MDEILSSSQCPQDAKLIVLILRSMGITQYEPAVVVQLLEFTHLRCAHVAATTGYAIETLSDAMQYAAHAEHKSSVDLSDLKLAIQARVNTQFTPAPSREILHSLAAAKNALPLPLPPRRAGAVLPPPELRLAAPNWHLASARTAPPDAALDEADRALKRLKREPDAPTNAPPPRSASHRIAIVTGAQSAAAQSADAQSAAAQSAAAQSAAAQPNGTSAAPTQQ